MKRKDINVYKLTHIYFDDEEDIFIKSDTNEEELCKLIKSIQIKTCDIEETYDLSPVQMRDVLFQYDEIRAFPNEEDILIMNIKNEDGFDYIELDLYNIWEACDIKLTDEEVYDACYKNDNAVGMIKNFIDEELISD